MRVALDARELCVGVSGGLERYTEALVLSLLSSKSDHAVQFYVDRQCEKLSGIPPHQLVFCGPKSLPIREQFGLPKMLKRDGIDLVHFPVNTAPLRCPVPYVLTLHDTICIERPYSSILKTGSIKNKAMSVYSRIVPLWAARRARLVFTVSSFSADQISRVTGVPRNTIRVTPQVVNPQFHPMRDSSFRDNILNKLRARRFVVILGSIEPRKNLQRMLSAVARAMEDDQELGLVMTWPSRMDLKGWLLEQKISLPERLLLMQDITDDELIKLYSNADGLLFVSTQEGFGLPVVEAMACGCPVITSNSSCLPETAGGAALLCDAYDQENIHNAVLTLVRDPDLSERQIAAGFERVKPMTTENAGQSLIAEYESVFKGFSG